MYTDYKMSDENIQDYQRHEQIINTISNRFITYGYKRIKTSAFEKYDLYTQVNSSINQNEMIKVIDNTGQVLVLRPDVTLPITRQIAREYTNLPNELRYFYIQDVYRQLVDRPDENIETTQAGVEYFCESSPEADAEVVALAIHTLKDLGFNDIKIEMGHAGFFKEIIQALHMNGSELEQLKNLIRAKNAVDIVPFLQKLPIEKNIKEAVEKIPFLYGDPRKVSERAKEIAFTKKMDERIDYFMKLYDVLEMYGLEKHIVMDLGLINHMGYYSDVIFQGFVEKLGKPVVMGGRYNQLGDIFHANLPAIGFACKVDSIASAQAEDEVIDPTVDITVRYDRESMAQSIKIASELRERNYSVLSFPVEKDSQKQNSRCKIWITKDKKILQTKDKKEPFHQLDDLLERILEAEEK